MTALLISSFSTSPSPYGLISRSVYESVDVCMYAPKHLCFFYLSSVCGSINQSIYHRSIYLHVISLYFQYNSQSSSLEHIFWIFQTELNIIPLSNTPLCVFVVEPLPSMCQDLGLIFSTAIKQTTRKGSSSQIFLSFCVPGLNIGHVVNLPCFSHSLFTLQVLLLTILSAPQRRIILLRSIYH
jgi:hypothetical protein